VTVMVAAQVPNEQCRYRGREVTAGLVDLMLAQLAQDYLLEPRVSTIVQLNS
jgi:hypothetical protein